MADFTLMEVTPELAQRYLDTRDDRIQNRPISKAKVQQYARDMKMGNWQVNNSSIAFDETGSLLDGQHRLTACIEAGVPFTTFIMLGCPSSSFATIDTGRARTKSQVFAMKHVPNFTFTAAIIPRVMTMRTMKATSIESVRASYTSGNYAPTNSELLAEYNARPSYWDSVTALAMRLNKHLRLINVSEVGAIFAHLNLNLGYKHDFVRYFFEQLHYEEQTKLQVIRLLRRKLLNDQISDNKMRPLVRTQLIRIAWDFYKRDKDTARISWKSGKDKELPFE